jgi:maleylpyruvate isomerase
VSDEVGDAAQISGDIASCSSSHRGLLTQLQSLGAIDPLAPSRLPGWTVAHVLTHIARNASGHLEMLAGRPQYVRGMESRNEDIEAGVRRSWPELIEDVEATCEALESGWHDVSDWSGTATTVAGNRPKRMLPLLRQREVEIHRVDLGLGYEFSDMPSEYVRKDLRLWEMQWRARKPMGLTPLPRAALAAPPHDRLAWFVGRLDIVGLEPAGMF